MTTEDTLNNLAKRLTDALPQHVRDASADLERNFRSVLNSGIGRMNLVTREEFDVQAAVLRRTRQKVEALEATLAELEAQLDEG